MDHGRVNEEEVNARILNTSLSIIITLEEEQQTQLRQILPLLLTQRYMGEYEVIVVDKNHDKDLEEWLDEIVVQHTHLSHTFCPSSSRGIDTHRLALTLGAKSANYDWLLIIPVETKVLNDKWLTELIEHLDPLHDVVLFSCKRKHRCMWLRNILHRSFSIVRPSSSVILCRKSILFDTAKVQFSKCKFVKL